MLDVFVFFNTQTNNLKKKHTDNNELYWLENNCKILIKQHPEIETSRVFGKFLGIKNDYWVIECTLSEYPEGSEEYDSKKMEHPGQGTNKYIYYVITNHRSMDNYGKWFKLPDIEPEQIKKSRKINRILTGDLNANVGGTKYFPWQENVLLRCMIARIASSCILSVSSFYKISEEAEEEEHPLDIVKNDEFEMPENVYTFDSWVHQRPHLRLEGRHKKWVNPESNEEDEEENNDKEEKGMFFTFCVYV